MKNKISRQEKISQSKFNQTYDDLDLEKQEWVNQQVNNEDDIY